MAELFDLALEKRFAEADEISIVNITGTDALLIKDTESGAIMRLPFSTLANAIKAAFATSFATLVDGKVPASQLPSYVDDVLEYANLAAFPNPGESGKIYIAIDTRKTFRWTSTVYAEVSPSDVNSVNGKTGAVTLAKADIGLTNVDNTTDLGKPISTATSLVLAQKANSAYPSLTGVVAVPDGIISSSKALVVAALNTPVKVSDVFSGLLRVRDNSNGGAALFLCDANGGVQTIGTNQITGLTVAFNASLGYALYANIASGSVPRNLGFCILGGF